jgi:hypothetical protein
LFCAAIVLFVSFPATTGASPAAGTVKVSPTPETPAYSGYKGVTIGTSMAETRSKLGKARDMSDYEDYYVVSDNETVQVQYDTDKTVKTISVNFIGSNPAAPAAKAVFGVDAEVRPDGGVFKMVRYPKAGYWVSYNKTTGDNAMVVVTMQKIPNAQVAGQ